MELDWLRTFLAVVDRGGFSAAAEHIHRSQSRVSAHIAALEREVGATLIDRTHRPVRLTGAGEVLAGHAREILGAVGSARSAVSAARDLDVGHLAVLTTPCLAAEFLPGVLTRVVATCPDARFAVLEDGRRDVQRRFLDEGVVLAVLPALTGPLVPGLRERLLWEEPLHVVVPPAHPFTRLGRPVRPDELLGEPLVVTGASGDTTPEAVDLLLRRGVMVAAAVTADSPLAVAALVDAGLGIGLLTTVAARTASAVRATGGPVVTLPLAGGDMTRRVAVYWYDALLGDPVGRILRREVLTAPLPAGVVRAGARPSGPREPGRDRVVELPGVVGDPRGAEGAAAGGAGAGGAVVDQCGTLRCTVSAALPPGPPGRLRVRSGPGESGRG